MFDFTGKTVLLTGSCGGIGRVIAKTLYDCGATVGMSDRSADSLATYRTEFADQNRIFTFPCSLGVEGAEEQLAKDAETAMGKVDILVNNAGLTKDNLFMRMNDADWDLVLKVNLTSGFKLARALVRGMMKRRYGRIVGMASIVGAIGNVSQANYAASKAGMIAMSKCLAQEVASRGITVNCVAPGFVKTPMTDALSDAAKEKLTARIPMERLGMPQDIANAVLFLASEEASYITGQTIHVNGGMVML